MSTEDSSEIVTDTRWVMISMSQIVTEWRPGSHDEPWSWMDEAHDLWQREPIVMDDLLSDVMRRGIVEPVDLGDDGRVWDGHHRIVIASALMFSRIPALVRPRNPTCP